MPDQKLSQLTPATTPTGAELVYVVQSGAQRRTTAQAIADLAPDTDLSYTAATRTLASSTGADVVLPLATDSVPGLLAAADKLRIDQLGEADSPTFAGLTVTGTAAVTIPHIHGDLAGAVYLHVKNTGATTLAAGTPVYAVGTVGDTTTVEVQAADSSNAAKMPAIGILTTSLAANASGHCAVVGEVTGLATGAYSIGAVLYVAAGGGLTATKPTTGTIQAIAVVGRVHASTGSVTVVSGAISLLALSSSAPQGLAATAAAGSSADAARADHQHQRDTEALIIPLGDETTVLNTGPAVTFPWPFPGTLLEVRAFVNQAGTGSPVIFDVNKAGTTMLGTKLSIDAAEQDSSTAASQATVVDNVLNQGSVISIDIDQKGSTFAGAGAKITMVYRRS